MTLRKLIEEFTYPEMERIAALTEREGDSTVYCGYPAMEDDSNMLRGALIRTAVHLAVREHRAGDPHAEVNFRRVNLFICSLSGRKTSTWGKLALLFALSELHDAGLLDRVTPESMKICRTASDYSDFLDKEKLLLLGGLPTNYYHVALACAGVREKLGFESEGMADKLQKRMLGIMASESSAGWSDEQPPYGRYDSYTLNAPFEIAEALEMAGREVPEFIRNNLRDAARMYLALRNPRGDGFPYGRSLAVHGDLSPAYTIMGALSFGLLTETEQNDAIAYIARIVMKIRDFWFDPGMGCINIWCGGRATDKYRNISRILEVNNGTYHRLHSILQTAEKLGIADDPIPESDFGYTDTWQCTETVFDDAPGKKRAAYILRRGDRIFTLPLIGIGSHSRNAVYQPFPAAPRFVEAPPEKGIPFLTPDYRMEDGRQLRPSGFYETVDVETGEDRCVITARGQMSTFDENKNWRYPQPYGHFTAVYTFEGERIRVMFAADEPIVSAEMVYAGDADVTGIGFAEEAELDTSSEIYHTAHGALKHGRQWRGSSADVGYEIKL